MAWTTFVLAVSVCHHGGLGQPDESGCRTYPQQQQRSFVSVMAMMAMMLMVVTLILDRFFVSIPDV
jgi:hypothetical protein